VCGIKLLVALDLQPMQVSKMSFGPDVSEKVRNIAESRSLRTNCAFEQFRRHHAQKERQQQIKLGRVPNGNRKETSAASK